jgi:hypothetical protein
MTIATKNLPHAPLINKNDGTQAAIFGDKKEEEQLPAGWTAHLDEKTGTTKI